MHRKWIGLIVFFLLMIVVGGQVAAHADIVDASPGPGDVINATPEAISITFSEPVQNASIQVLRDGTFYPVTLETGDDVSEVRGTLQTDLEAGVYQVLWTVDSADTHGISGAYSFEIQPEEDGMNWPLVGGVAGAIILVISVTGIVWKRRAS